MDYPSFHDLMRHSRKLKNKFDFIQLFVDIDIAPHFSTESCMTRMQFYAASSMNYLNEFELY